MKKLLSILALALAFVACQTETAEVVSNNDLVDVMLTVDAPELGVTRADNDGKNERNSALGGIDFMNDADWANYDLRYILEVYAEDDETGANGPIYRERLVNCLDKYAPTTFALRLVPNRDYKFVVFADYVAEGNAELTEPADKLAIADLYYNTADLRNITCITENPSWNAMNEVRDAYFISKNMRITTGLNETLTLTRPFAKLRVIATDLDYISGYTAPGYVKVTYKNEKIYKSFNAVSGKLNDAEMTGDELTYGFAVNKNIPYSAGYDAYSTNQTLFADYLLAVEGEQTTVNFEMEVYESEGGRLIHTQDFNTQIPIQRNHLTTIIGDILTTQANITIDISDDFVDEYVKGWGDDNATLINTWESGNVNAEGNYEFVVKSENDFIVTINGAAVKNGKLTAGDYILAQDAEENAELTFTVTALQANATTRALTAVDVIGGDMKVATSDKGYAITLDLVLQFIENNDVRHAIYTYEGPIAFGKILETPTVEAKVEGNVITLSWNAVEGATKYSVTCGTEMPVITEETSYVFTGEYETQYSFVVVAISDDLNSQPYTVVATTTEAPAEEFKPEVSEWGIAGDITNWGGVADIVMYTTETNNLFVAEKVDIKNGSIKIRANNVWNDAKNYGFEVAGKAYADKYYAVITGAGSQNMTPMEYGTYDVYFDLTNKRIALMTPGKAYAEAENGGDPVVVVEGLKDHTWGLIGSFAGSDWGTDVAMAINGDWAVAKNVTIAKNNEFKFRADGNWTLSYGSGSNVVADKTYDTYNNGGNMKFVGETGAYDVYFSMVNAKFYMTPATAEPVALATPMVSAAVEGNVVTLSWETVENAAQYGITVGTEMPVFVEETTYVFTGEYETEYTFNVVAVPADEEQFAVSEAAVVTATTDAEPVVEEKILTVAEFLALTDVVPSDATPEMIAAAPMYTLKGTVTAVANSSYGNFDLTDETGTVLIYGLMSPDGATNKYWATAGVKLGDEITVKTIRTEYNNAPQGKNAWYVEHSTPGSIAFWVFETTAVSFTADGGDKAIALAIYNTTADVEVASDSTQFSAAYTNGTLTISALENTSTESSVDGNITVTCGSLKQDITVTQAKASTGEQSEVTGELKFVKDNRTSFTTSQQVWEANNIKLVNDKGSSTSNIADYVNPARFYKSSKITVSAPGVITTIVFDCNSTSYATALKSSITTGTVSVASDKVTVVLDGSSNDYVISSLTGGQVRMDSMTVTYLE